MTGDKYQRLLRNMAVSRRLAVALVAWGTVEVVLFAGQVFGWASLVYVFKQEGYFSKHCGNESQIHLLDNVSNAVGSIDDGDLRTAAPPGPVGGGAGRYAPADRRNATLGDRSLDLILLSNSTRERITDGDETVSEERERGGEARDEGDGACDEQDWHLNLVYTVAVVITGVSTFANGWLLDRHGTRACRSVGLSAYTLGILMLAFSGPTASMVLYPAIVLLSYGGYFFLFTNLQLANLIPDKRATIISLFCGAFDSSSFVMVLIKIAYENGVSLKDAFLVVAFLFSLVYLTTFWYMPRTSIPHPLPDNFSLNFSIYFTCRPPCKQAQGQREIQGSREGQHKVTEVEQNAIKDKKTLTDQQEKLLTDMSEKEKDDPEPSFRSILISPLFIWDVVWLSCHRFASWSFIGRLNPVLTNLSHGNTALVSQYTSVYAMMQFVGIALAPLSGRLMDRRKTPQKDVPPNPRLDKLEMCVASFLIDTTLGLLLSITLTIPVLEVQYASFALHVVHRALLYGPNAAFLALSFPMKHFGKLFGLAMTLSAAFGLVQFPVFLLIQGPLNNDPLVANLLTLVLMLVSYGHPVHIWWRCRQERQDDLQAATSSPIYKPNKPFAIELTNSPIVEDGNPEDVQV